MGVTKSEEKKNTGNWLLWSIVKSTLTYYSEIVLEPQIDIY